MGKYELHKACYMGNIEKVKQLVTPENVNNLDDFNHTPLQSAMLGRKNIKKIPAYLDIAMILIDKGADINKAVDGTTPPIKLCPDLSSPLISYNNEIKQANTNNKKIENKNITITVTRLPVMKAKKQLALPMKETKPQEIPVKVDTSHLLHKACYMGDFEKVKELATPENINTVNDFGHTPIQTAMIGFKNIKPSENYVYIAMILIDKGANPSTSKYSHIPSAIEIAPAAKAALEFYYYSFKSDGIGISTDHNAWNYALSTKGEIIKKDKSLLKSFKNSAEFIQYWNQKFLQNKQR